MRCRIFLIALGTFLPAPAYADSCIMKQHVVAQSSDGRYIVRLDRADVWKGRIEDTKLETVFEANPDVLHWFRGGKLLICVPVNHGTPRPRVVDAKGFGGEYWIETLQRRKPRK